LNNFAGNTGNLIRNNRVTGNGRAGIAALAAAANNAIEGNDARGNGLLNLAPTLLFDLFDAPPLNNTWANNQGSFNVATSATALLVTEEAFGAGGCMRAAAH
jgi:parallel beta-helix repeat protein